MLAALWNCFSIPLFVAFHPPVADQPYIFYINSVIDFLFFLDILLNFRTSYINQMTGDEIKNPVEIAKNYVLGYRFAIDLAATIPFDLLVIDIIQVQTNSTTLQLFGLLKLIRILRLGKIIATMRIQQDLKVGLKLFKLLLFLVTYIHLLTCMWFLMTMYEENWIAPTDWLDY